MMAMMYIRGKSKKYAMKAKGKNMKTVARNSINMNPSKGKSIVIGKPGSDMIKIISVKTKKIKVVNANLIFRRFRLPPNFALPTRGMTIFLFRVCVKIRPRA